MAIHKESTFIRKYSEGDELIIIQNDNNSVTYEIKPWNVNSIYIKPKTQSLIVKLRGSDYSPDINFDNYAEAIKALTKLQDAIDFIKDNVSNVPQEIKDYVKFMGSFIFRQITPSEDWDVFEHGLGRHPSVIITDDNLNVMEGHIQYIDSDNVKVKFNIPLKGWVFLN